MRRWKKAGTAALVVLCLFCVPTAAGLAQARYAGAPGFDAGPDLGEGYGGFESNRRRGPSRRFGPFQSYHGFRIDLGEAQGVIDVPTAVAEVEHQIDIVDRSGLSPSMLATFRRVPIRLSVAFGGGGGHYRGGSEVILGSLQPGDDRPVLLHEYMHALEYLKFPGGFHNATVRRFYDEARAAGLYEPGSYMMSNPPEFWAVTASCFLNGSVAREPYTRANIRQRQPDYYAYLERVFGPRGGTASAGSPAQVAATQEKGS